MKNKLKKSVSILAVVLVAVLLSACSILGFDLSKPFDVVISTNDGGVITGGGAYDKDETALLTATAEDGYVFYGWLDDRGLLVSNATPFEFVVKEDTKLTAKFLRDDTERFTFNYQIKTENELSEIGGAILIDHTFDYSFDLVKNVKNKIMKLKAEAKPGYAFAGWEKDSKMLQTKHEFDYTLSSSEALIANFVLIENSTQGLVGRSFARVVESGNDVSLHIMHFEAVNTITNTTYSKNSHLIEKVDYVASMDALHIFDEDDVIRYDITILNGKVTLKRGSTSMVFFEFTKDTDTAINSEYYLYEENDSLNEKIFSKWIFDQNGNVNIVYHTINRENNEKETKSVQTEYFIFSDVLVVCSENETHLIGKYSFKTNYDLHIQI